MSSGFLVKLDGPGVGFVVEPALAQAAVKDAGELIGECSDSHGVRLVAGLELLVVAASTGRGVEGACCPSEGGVSQQAIAGDSLSP